MSAATLLVLDGPDEGTRCVLDREPLLIGRGAGCRMRLADGEASRKHASIRWDGARHVVADLDSSNGTLLNGEPLGKSRDVALRNGDRVRIGMTTLLFSEPPKEADSRPAVGLVDLTGGDEHSRIIGRADAVAARDALTQGGEQATVDLRALYRIAEIAAHRGPDLSDTAGEILDVTVSRLDADRGCVLLADKKDGRIKPLAIRVEDEPAETSIPVSRSIVDYVLRHGKGVRTTDARADERFDGEQSIVRAGIREALCVPIEGREGTLGVIYVDTTPIADVLIDEDDDTGPKFDDGRLNWLMAVGRQCGLAVDNDRYEKAIVRAERLATMGRTVAALSHHVKNIVQGLKGGSYLIEKGLEKGDDEQIRRGWDVTSRNQARIYDFVQDMLSFSKERTPQIEPGPINDVVAEVVELARGRMPDAKITLEFEPAEPSPRAGFDAEAIHRAALNVVLNALEAVESESAPAVRVRTGTSQDGATVFIAVIDNGPGIPEGQLEAIFTPFESSKGARGTGLGLPVTRKILREHGGDVRAESRPGEGSRFLLTLPADITGTSDDG